MPKTPEEKIAELEDAIVKMQKQLADPPTHYHNGFDSNILSWFDIGQKQLYVHHTIQGVSAATAGYYGVFLIVPAPGLIVGFKEVHSTAGTDGGAVTLDLEKLTGTTAAGSGVTALNSTLSLKAAANTVQTATITFTSANKTLAGGDRLALKLTGTPTSLATVSVLLTLQLI